MLCMSCGESERQLAGKAQRYRMLVHELVHVCILEGQNIPSQVRSQCIAHLVHKVSACLCN